MNQQTIFEPYKRGVNSCTYHNIPGDIRGMSFKNQVIIDRFKRT